MPSFFILLAFLLLWTTSVIGVNHSVFNGDSKGIMYTQWLDHFECDELCNVTFPQRVLINDSRWAGAEAGAPIFVYFGGFDIVKANLDQMGLLSLCASKFKGMIVYIEHRFKGNSAPLGSTDSAMKDHRVRARLSTDQALQDFANIIESLKANLSAHKSPVIVVGEGYGGALATWFRLKYPDIAIGALASSTPLLYYGSASPPRHEYCRIVSNDFKSVDPDCYLIIQQSWKILDDIGERPNGLEKLSQKLHTCSPIQSIEEVKQWLAQLFSYAAQYDDAKNVLIGGCCTDITAQPSFPDAWYAALKNQIGVEECYQAQVIHFNSPFEPFSSSPLPWQWLRCTELIYPMECIHDTMLPSSPFNLTRFEQFCQNRFGTVRWQHSPKSFFGSQDKVVEALIKSEGNIIFSNGLRDPFSSGGILNDLSKTIVAITSTNGSYGQEMSPITPDDPSWLIKKREMEVKIFQSWINHFHHISRGSNHSSFNVLIYILELLVLFLIYL